MREIKFRGKKVGTGEWIYGMPTYDFRFIFNSVQNDSPDNYEIIPETIGQYTGLKDKTGKEIYEGDILERIGTRDNLSTIDFPISELISRELIVVELKINEDGYGKEFFGFSINKKKTYSERIHPASYEIIGNIYTNPELLELCAQQKK